MILVCFAGCAPSPKAIQEAVEQTMTALPTSTATAISTSTATPKPTPTLIPLSEIDLNMSLLNLEDLPEGYVLGDVEFGNRGINQIIQHFNTDNLNTSGSYGLALYEQKSDAINDFQELLNEKRQDSITSELKEFGEIGFVNIQTISSTYVLKVIYFVRCNALISVIGFDDLLNLEIIAGRLDKQMEQIACRN